MRLVYLLQHLHVLPHGKYDVKTIGVYSSKEMALAAVYRLKIQPGFKDFPNMINPEHDEQADGFSIDEFLIDQDHWQEGYETV